MAVRLYMTGLSWLWLFPVNRKERAWWINALETTALSLLTGVLFSVMLYLVMGETGHLNPWISLVLTVGWMLIGLVLGLIFRPDHLVDRFREGLLGAVLTWGVFVIIMLLPARGEWILGGWDPGIYVNHSLYAARAGTFYPPAQPLYRDLSNDEMSLFTRGADSYIEAFPGCPVNPVSRRFELYFFRFTPSFITLCAQNGGLRAAVRTNLFAGFFSVILFSAFLLRRREDLPLAFCALLIMISRPVWLYHLHVPISEMLQLFLICGAGLLIHLRRSSPRYDILLGFTLFAAVVNRLSFLPFGAVLIAGTAWLDKERPDRASTMKDRLWLMVMLMLGLGLDMLTSPATIHRVANVVTGLTSVTVGVLAVTLFWEGLCRRTGWRTFWTRREENALKLAGLILMFYPIALCVFGQSRPFDEGLQNICKLTPFLGEPALLLAFGGIVFLIWNRRTATREVRFYILFLVFITMVFLSAKHIANLFPWATRRFLAYTTPAVAVGAAVIPAWIWKMPGLRVTTRRLLTVLLMVAIIGLTARTSWHAWKRTEYEGVSTALSEAVSHIPQDAVIVADHPWWGTPLTYIYGRQVLNGKRIWSDTDQADTADALKTLHRLHQIGYKIYFFCSTDDEMGVYPCRIPGLVQIWQSAPLTTEEIIHHQNAADYEVKTKHKVFTIYRWEP